ncbi:SRPBCC family protein [Demequina sp. SYSU T00192]|uniref:SRPBCC family protein n=1 Tax=Demequina litoralis TaxID=3051660 RepID=A0ABT8G9V2_9MICO|nr:SRPBCC family protein [Demequina sp. SYSU T00192]MDN4475906.1 SRPBCC family protein [Demequina sp. SYSU T00192]
MPALEGAALIAVHLAATPFVGEGRRTWGTVGTEATDALPGDDLVPDPRWAYTLGVDVAALPEAVWPWIAQIGQGRGGFYSYQVLENLVGCRIVNTGEILPEHQRPVVGDEIRLHPEAPPMRVAAVDPPHALVLAGTPVELDGEAGGGAATWQFVVRDAPGGRSRLLTRGRYDHGDDWGSRLAFGRFPLEAIAFVMSRRMMREIARLAEGRA